MPGPDPGIYTRLQQDPFEIRLLQILTDASDTIVCRLSTVQLDSAPEYQCLSYVWGEQEWHPIKVMVNDEPELKTLHVTKNLAGFLQLASAHPDDAHVPKESYLWIDAISINQQNEVEKGSQVREMGSIYSRASRVVAWLGWQSSCDGSAHEGDRDEKAMNEISAEAAVEYIREFAGAFSRWSKMEGGVVERKSRVQQLSQYSFLDSRMYDMLQVRRPAREMWAAIAQLLRRAWFGRAWIVQEVVLAKSLILVCGSQSLPWDDLLQLWDFLEDSGWGNKLIQSGKTGTQMLPMSRVGTFAKMRQLRHHIESEWQEYVALQGESPSLDQREVYLMFQSLIVWTRPWEALQARDKVFAPLTLLRKIIGRIGNTEVPDPDYGTPVVQLYTEITGQILENVSTLDLLCHREDASHRQIDGLPSWVPDYTCLVAFTSVAVADLTTDVVPGMPKSCEFSPLDWTLKLRGCVLDTVKRLGPPLDPMGASSDFRMLIEFCETLDALYENGQDRCEVLWRTLIIDFDGQNFPARSEMAASCKRYLQWRTMCAVYGVEVDAIATTPESWVEWKCFDRLQSSSSQAALSIPSVQELADFAQGVRKMANDNDLDRIDSLWKPLDTFATALSRAHHSKSLCVSDRELLCFGPASTEPGDQIWFVFGCRMPLMLRPVGDQAVRRRLRLVGETYVHGYMQGEILHSREESDFESIVLE